METCNKCGFNPHHKIYKCQKCGASINSPGCICPKCHYNPFTDHIIKCMNCGEAIDNPGAVCLKCHYNPHDDYIILCPQCKMPKKSVLSICKQCSYDQCNDSRGGGCNFINIDGQEFVYDHRVDDYVLWENFKPELESKARVLEDTNLFNAIKSYFPQAICVPTFITCASKTDPDHRFMEGIGIFQHYLVERGIGWNIYVKFGIIDNILVPLVAGKSGTLLVNSGHDLNFSLEEQTPARKYLLNNKGEWYSKGIIIVPLDSEEDALNKEKELLKLVPFGS
jgi:hypothetical protein